MRLPTARLWIMGSAVLLTILVWLSVWFVLSTEETLSAAIPVFTHRWIIVDLSYHHLQYGSDDSGTETFRELRVRAGTENTTTDTYQRFADVTVPIWPLP